jgi:hypothetical protein
MQASQLLLASVYGIGRELYQPGRCPKCSHRPLGSLLYRRLDSGPIARCLAVALEDEH